MRDLLVSVIVPVYNVEKYLDRCVSSIVNQTYRNLEIILVDDGSSDRCPEMCDAWAEKDNRIKVIHKKNAGLGMARNTGIEHAAGACICFFDSDDYIHETTIEKAYRAMIDNRAEIVIFGMSRVDARGTLVRSFVPEPDRTVYRDADVQEVFLPDLIDANHADVKNYNLMLSACVCLCAMDLIRRTGWQFVSERETISEDSYSLIWLYRYVKSVAILPEALYFYCENRDSLTQTYREDRFRRIKDFYNTCVRMAEEIGHNPVVCSRVSGLFLSFSIAAMKQITAADLPHREKREALAGIVEDDLLQKILSDPDCRYRSLMRRLLFLAMRRKLHGIVYLLTKAQVMKERVSHT